MKLGIEALPTAHLKPGRDPRKRQSRFPAQPRCDRWFVGVAFGSLAQIVLPPLQPFELFPDDPPGLALRAFPLQFAGVMFAQPALQVFQKAPALNSADPRHQPLRIPCHASSSLSSARRASLRRSNSCRPATVSRSIPCAPSNRSTRNHAGRCGGAASYNPKLLQGYSSSRCSACSSLARTGLRGT